MTQATPFLDWVIDPTQIFNSSISVYTNSGTQGSNLVSSFVFGIIPLILGFMIYSRYQKMGPALFVVLLAMLGITGVEIYLGQVLVAGIFMSIGYVLVGFALTFILVGQFFKSNE